MRLPPIEVGSDWVFVASAVAAALGLWVLVAFRRRSHRSFESARPFERRPREHQAADVSSDLRQMLVELEDLTRNFSEQLDARSSQLQKLIAEADRRIQDLRGATNHEPQPASDGEQPDPLTRKVYALADAGRTPLQIAQALDEQPGKVELILALRRG